jgi:hypothetical protein
MVDISGPFLTISIISTKHEDLKIVKCEIYCFLKVDNVIEGFLLILCQIF